MKKKSNSNIPIITSVIIGAITAVFVIYFMNNFGHEKEISQEPSTFMSDAGPILQLSILEDDADITATRNLVLDFTNFGNSSRDIKLIDSYTLTNETDTAQTVQILYPIATTFLDIARSLPTILLENNPLEIEFRSGDTTRLNIENHNWWRHYANIISDATYQNQALAEMPNLNQTVTIYQFTDVKSDFSRGEAPTLDISFNIDFSATTVLSYGFNGMSIDTESGDMRKSFSIPRQEVMNVERTYYMIVIGENIEEMTIQGYENGGLNPGEEIDITFLLERYEMALSDVLMEIIEDFVNDWWTEENTSIFNPEMRLEIYRNVANILNDSEFSMDSEIFHHSAGMIEELISQIIGHERIFYLTTELTIPASSAVDLTVNSYKQGSFDFYAAPRGNEGVNGFDMLPLSGSYLNLNQINIELVGYENIEIVRQNFGFDLTKNITNIEIDVDELHYFIEVRMD